MATVEATRSARRAQRRRVSPFTVFGELLITAGVLVLLFVVWQMWINDAIEGSRNNAIGQELSEQWASAADGTEPLDPGVWVEPVVRDEAADAEEFGVMWVPRFGEGFHRPIAGGVSRERTLDAVGIGHYPDTAMPGGVGNAAFAAHRTGYGGAPFYQIGELRIGDALIIETEDGWYTYRFRNLEYVPPSAVGVLDAVPQATNPPEGERYLTLTTCHPKHTIDERVIAYSVFDSFQPRSAGPPESLTEVS